MSVATGGVVGECQAGGSDSNGGLFNPAATAGGTVTVTGLAPLTVSDGTFYTFVPGDVGAFLYIQESARANNWTPGWYKITAVNSGVATLDTTVGHVLTSTNNRPSGLNNTTNVNNSTNAAAAYLVDYSQQTSPVVTSSNFATPGGSGTLTNASAPFTPAHIGNCLQITSAGSNGKLGFYMIAAYVSSTQVTLDAEADTGPASSGQTGQIGGCLATPGQMGGAVSAGSTMYLKNGSYSQTSGSSNVAGGSVSMTGSLGTMARLLGYNAWRGDNPTTASGNQPTITVTGAITTFTMVTGATAALLGYVTLNCNSKATSTGSTALWNVGVLVKNSTNLGFGAAVACLQCGVTGHSGSGGFGNVPFCCDCEAWAGTAPGFLPTSNIVPTYVRCSAWGHTGSTVHGFSLGGSTQVSLFGCVSYNNTGDGFNWTTITTRTRAFINCIASSNGRYGFNDSSGSDDIASIFTSAAYNNTSGATNNVTGAAAAGLITCAVDPFINAAGGNFALNNTALGGALLRAAGFVGNTPSGGATGHEDIGAIQSAAGASGMFFVQNLEGNLT